MDEDMRALAQTLESAWTASASVIGFHHLAEETAVPLDRTLYEAQAYASGYALAVQVARLSHLLKPYDRIHPGLERSTGQGDRPRPPQVRGPAAVTSKAGQYSLRPLSFVG